MYEQPIFNFNNIVHQKTTKLPTDPSSTISTSSFEQLSFGGGEFIGSYDRDALPVDGSSFLAWRCHGIDLNDSTWSSTSNLLRTLTPSSSKTTVLDMIEIPFTPTKTTEGGTCDLGTPNQRNKGAIRFVLPEAAGIVTGTTSMYVEHATGTDSNDGSGSNGHINFCIATNTGYLYQIKFPHHPNDAYQLQNTSTGIQSSLSRSEPTVTLHTFGLKDSTDSTETFVVGTSQWLNTNTILISNLVPEGPAAIININTNNTTENNNMNNMSNSNVVEMIPLSCQAETNSVSQIISGISGWIGTVVGVGAASQQSTSSNYKKSVLSNIQRSNTFDASSSSSSSSANSVTPYQLWKDTKALRPGVNHLCGTLMETGLGKVAVVVLSGHQFNGTDSNDSSSSTGITKYGGIEIWNEMYNGQDVAEWCLIGTKNGIDVSDSFARAISSTTQSSNMKISGCAYGLDKSTLGLVITFNEYDNDDTTCVTRVLRLEGSLSSENDQEAAVGPAGMSLSVILPPLNKLGQDEEHVDQESLLTGVVFDENVTRRYSDVKMTRVVSLHLDIVDMNEDQKDEEGVPTLTILLEITNTEHRTSTLLLHHDRYDETNAQPRIETTLNSTRARSIDSERDQLRIDFNIFEKEENENENGQQSKVPKMTPDDIEEHFMRRVTVPGRYSTNTILSSIFYMLNESVVGTSTVSNGGRKMECHSLSDLKIRISRCILANSTALYKKDEDKRQRSHLNPNLRNNNSTSQNEHEQEEDNAMQNQSPQIRAWRNFILHCEKKEKESTCPIGLIQSICLKYDTVEDDVYVSGKHVLGVVRESTISLLRPPTSIELLHTRMKELTMITITPFSMSSIDEVLIASGLLMMDANKSTEGKELVFQLLNTAPLHSLDGNDTEQYGLKSDRLLNELCDVLEQSQTETSESESLTFQCHSLLSTHVRRFGAQGFKEIINNILNSNIPMKNVEELHASTRPRGANNDSPRMTAASAAYSASTLRDVASVSVLVSVSVALCLKMTLRRCLHGTGVNQSVRNNSSSSSSSVDSSLRSELSFLLRNALLNGVLLRSTVLRDLGDCTVLGKSPQGDEGDDGGGGRMTTCRMKRLVFDEDSDHLENSTSHGGSGFVDLMRHNASSGATVEESDHWTSETDGPLDVHMSLWSTSTTLFNVDGRSVLEVLLLYYSDVVPMEGSEETTRTSGGGRSIAPSQWFHDVAINWSDVTMNGMPGNEIPLSMAHVIGFLMSRGQIELLARVCAGMLSASSSTNSSNSSSFNTNAQTAATTSSSADLAHLRVLGECWLTTSDRLSDDNNSTETENMNLAFRYLLRSCPAKQIDAYQREEDEDDHIPHMTLEEADENIDIDTVETVGRASRRDRILYLMAMMRSFASARRPRSAVLCARSAIASIGEPLDFEETVLSSTLWRSVFTQSIVLKEFDEAWLAVGSIMEGERSFCVQQLVSAMYDAQALDVLLRLPLVHGVKSNVLELEKALEKKASFTPLDFGSGSSSSSSSCTETVTVHHYIYAIHIKHNNYRKASEIMYNLAKAAVTQGMASDKSLITKRKAIDLCTDALTTASSALRLLSTADERYILVSDTQKNNHQHQHQGNQNMREKEKEKKENVNTALKPIWLEDIRCKVIHNRLRLLLLNRYENSKTLKQHRSPHTSNTTYSRNNKKRLRSIDESLQDVSMRDSKNNSNNSNNSNNNDEINENLTSNYLQYTPLQMTNLMMGYAFPTVREYELCIETAVLHTIDHHRPNDQITPTNDVRIKWLTPVVDKMSSSFVLLRLKENDRNDENKQEVLRLEQLLKNVLARLDGIESGHALHTVAVDSMLSTDDSFGIPAWLINSMQGGVGSLRYGRSMPSDITSTRTYLPNTKCLPTFSNSGGNPTKLIETYMKHGRLSDACDVASTVISNVNLAIAVESDKNSGSKNNIFPSALVPHSVLDLLLSKCVSTLAANQIVPQSNVMVAHQARSSSSVNNTSMDIDDEEDDQEGVTDKRVVTKLKSSMNWLEESLVNYFDGQLEINESYDSYKIGEITPWKQNDMGAALS